MCRRPKNLEPPLKTLKSNSGLIHVIESKPVAATGSSLIEDDEQSPNEQLFEDTMELLTQSLLGDRFAAKFLLCSLVSSIYMRRAELVLGPITVNLNLKETEGKGMDKFN